ncbi:MAG: hypothetical protein NT056_05175 [Proteobacteria bacterium]|nr:hypothetical protein [Pseudomonadota bacterium]
MFAKKYSENCEKIGGENHAILTPEEFNDFRYVDQGAMTARTASLGTVEPGPKFTAATVPAAGEG